MSRVAELPPEALKAVTDAIGSLRYGSVEIVIHDGKIVQIVRTERLRVEGKEKPA
jgi:hypothetical protein